MKEKKLKVEVYFAPTCPTKAQVEKNLREALELEGVDAELTLEILPEDKAKELGFRGSPTILINGEEFQPLEMGGWS